MCVQISRPHSGEVLILDSGTGIRALGNHLVQNDSKLSGHLFLTHPHWDHLQGFPFFKPIYDPKTSLKVHLPRQPRGSCRDILAGQMTETYFPVTPDMLQANIEYITQPPDRTSYGDFSVEFILANHHTNTAIYKFYIDDKKLIFAPDNEIIPFDMKSEEGVNESLKEFVADADLVIHDGQYSREMYEKKQNWGHSDRKSTIDLMREAGVSNLILTHHDPDSNDSHLSTVQNDLQVKYGEDFNSLQLAYEDLVLDI